MNFLFPLKQALTTPVGDLLTFLIIAFAITLLFYLYFWLRFGRQKDLSLCHQPLFKRTVRQLKDLTFRGFTKSDFFGRKQIVSLPDGRYGQCLIFYPELSNASVYKRFEEYHLLLLKEGGAYFPQNIFRIKNTQLVNVETQYMKANGQSLVNFAHYSLDKTFSDAEKELFLIDIAYMLEALHRLKTESGEHLYHGFLLPSSFYLTINLVKKVTNIYLSEHGCAFSLASNTFQKWFLNISQGKYILDPFMKSQIEKYQFIFSPEQKAVNETITSATDFYSFGALSVYLFTQKSVENLGEVDWKQVPATWQYFLKECLNSHPANRPTNFLELKEYFNAPDLEIEGLNRGELIGQKTSVDPKLESLRGYIDEIHKIKQEYPFFDQTWHEGYVAIKKSQWSKAHNIFEKMQEGQSTSFNAELGLAILYYQKGEEEKAKSYYHKAKKIDAKKISCFHKLIGFDI